LPGPAGRTGPGENPLGSVAKTELDIEVAVDVVAVLDRLGAQSAGLRALQLDLMIGAKPFDYGIEALTRPAKQRTKPMDRDGVATVAEALISGEKLLAEGLRLDEPGELFLVVKPATQGLSHAGVA
jgi:hypothetical protein